MKVVMTLLVRDEADIVDAQLAFHLNSGVDLVIATDNDSQDGTTEILESYERDGYLRLLRSHAHDHSQPEIVTHMARLAAASGADWVINSDADEFWWPRGGSLAEILAEIPPDYGTVHASVRTFVPRPAGVEHFAERMIVRAVPHAPLFEPTSAYRPVSKVVHRAHPAITVGAGNHSVAGGQLATLRGWYPIEVLHFPWRSADQVTRKASIQAGSRAKMRRPPRGYEAALRSGTLDEWFASLAVSEDALERGLAKGSLAVDTRLRDALRSLASGLLSSSSSSSFARPRDGSQLLEFPTPNLVDEAAYAIDTGVLAEAEILRAQKRLDALDARIATLERRFVPRVIRRLRRSRSAPDGDPRS